MKAARYAPAKSSGNMPDDEAAAMDEALQAAAVLGAALARFENAVDRLKKAQAIRRSAASMGQS